MRGRYYLRNLNCRIEYSVGYKENYFNNRFVSGDVFIIRYKFEKRKGY